MNTRIAIAIAALASLLGCSTPANRADHAVGHTSPAAF